MLFRSPLEISRFDNNILYRGGGNKKLLDDMILHLEGGKDVNEVSLHLARIVLSDEGNS